MHYSKSLWSLAGLLASVSALVSKQPPLTMDPVFTGSVIRSVDGTLNTTGAFGTRIYAPVTESVTQFPKFRWSVLLKDIVCRGNLTDVKTGQIVATLLPTADNGIVDSAGVYFPSIVLPFSWKEDGKLVSFICHGIG